MQVHGDAQAFEPSYALVFCMRAYCIADVKECWQGWLNLFLGIPENENLCCKGLILHKREWT